MLTPTGSKQASRFPSSLRCVRPWNFPSPCVMSGSVPVLLCPARIVKVGQQWGEAKSWNVLGVVRLDVLTLGSTFLALPHRRPLSEVSSGMCQYWGVSYSERLLSLLEQDRPKWEASGAPSFKDFFTASQAQWLFPQIARGTSTLLQVCTFSSSFLSTRKSEVAAAQTWLTETAPTVLVGEENGRKDNTAIEVPSPSSSWGL